MTMALRTSADNAEDVAAGFLMFRDPLPEHATEITSLIADLYAISVSLKCLDDLTSSRVYRHIIPQAQPDLELVRASLKYTLEDIVDFFGDLEVRPGSNRGVYKRTWSALCTYFEEESQDSLSTRLAKYKSFLSELQGMIKGKHSDSRLMARLRSNINTLLLQQEAQVPQIAPRLGAITLGPSPSSNNSTEPSSPVGGRRPRNRRSYERHRPSSSQQSPQSPLSPSSGTFSSEFPPSAPDAPASSQTTDSTSQSLTSNAAIDHWAKSVFMDEHTITALPNREEGEISKCFGDPNQGVKKWLREEGFEDLFQLGFTDNSGLRVHMYFREEDHRARIVCKVPRARRANDYYCLPLNLLEVVRVGPCLQLRRRRRGGDELWANLKFTTVERMVLFFCTFLALRSQDCGRPVEKIRDYELEDEEELFGGQIVDDNYLHALRIYHDLTTDTIRLQASVHRGEMKRSPVWNAFLMNHLTSRNWIRRCPSDPKVVLIRDLRVSVFAFQDYTPPVNARGEHILKFISRSDAEGFLQIIGDLADSYRAEAYRLTR